jgi:hypothetical protein
MHQCTNTVHRSRKEAPALVDECVGKLTGPGDEAEKAVEGTKGATSL